MCAPRCVMTLGILLVTVGFIVLAILLSEALPRFLWSLDFKETQCTVNSQVFFGNICCTTESSDPDIWSNTCNSGIEYPCYAVKVTFDKEDSTTISGTLFSGYTDAKYQGDNLTCSRYNCFPGTTYSSGLQDVTDWMGSFTIGESYNCVYDPNNEGEAFSKAATDLNTFVQSTIWFTVILVVGIVVIVVSFVCEKSIEGACMREEEGRVLVKGGAGKPEVRTESLYGYENSGAMAEIDSDRPTTAAAQGLMVKSQDMDSNSLFVPGPAQK